MQKKVKNINININKIPAKGNCLINIKEINKNAHRLNIAQELILKVFVWKLLRL